MRIGGGSGRKDTYSVVVGYVSDQTADGLGGPGLLVDIAVDGSCRVEIVLFANVSYIFL